MKKILVSMFALFALVLMCMIPGEKQNILENIPQELEYVSSASNKHEIFLMDVNGYLARSNISLNSKTVIEQAKELINTLIKGSSEENKIPNGFVGIIPSDTKIIDIEYKDKLIKINFSKELLDVNVEMEEKIIEAIVYNLTSLDDVEKIMIFIEGKILSKLPQTGINLPSTFDRTFGINKQYDIKNTNNINSVTIYYINKYNDKEYYVPVTKYVNDDREKIKIIIDELSSSTTYNSNLMSYLNSNTKLLAISESVDSLNLVFNSYILNDLSEQQILEEIIYTISLSVKDNYNVEQVVFQVDDTEICKTVIKSIE